MKYKGLTPLALLSLLLFGGTPAMAYEEPEFEVIAEFEGFEIRRYQPFVIAEVEINGDFEKVGNRAFSILADYISGANRGTTKIEMTAPVIQAPVNGKKMERTVPVLQRSASDADSHLVSFVLPLRFDLATAPQPTDPRVRLREVPARVMAVNPYSGFWSEQRYRKHEADLLAALDAKGYKALGPPEWARYNPPFTPWFLRRNEVLVEISEVAGKEL